MNNEKPDAGAELVLGLIRQEYFCAIANAGSEHAQYGSVSEATLAMLRAAYQAGVKSAQPPPEFDADVQKTLDANEAAKRHGTA